MVELARCIFPAVAQGAAMRSVVHVVATLDPRSGGLREAVLGLSRALRRRGEDSIQILSNDGKEALDHFGLNSEDRRLFCSAECGSGITALLRQRRRPLLSANTPPDIVHTHGLWTPLNHLASSEAKRGNVKLVVQTHGMLDQWALDQSRLKKMLALYAYQKRDLTRADLLVATCTNELESLRTFGLRNPVAVIPNGINMSCLRSFDAIDDAGRLKTALFLSRLHPKKGLEDLLIAWSLIRPKGWKIRVVGDGDPAYVKKIEGLITAKGLIDQVLLEGGCYGEERYQYYEEADLFILPSYGENFGMVVLEALIHGLPVLTTDRTPWEALATSGSGWIVEPGVEPLMAALSSALALGNEQHKSMRASARKLARQYSLTSSAAKLAEAYHWVLNGGATPATIYTD